MVKGIGTDIIEIERIKNSLNKQSFLDKIYTKAEQKLYHGINPQTLAGNFAAKEAVAKALGTGFAGFGPTDIEVLRDERGKPYVNLYNTALDIFRYIDGSQVWVSISHNKDNAVAFAVIEG